MNNLLVPTLLKLAESGGAGTSKKTNPAKWEAAKRKAKAKMGGKHSARAMQLATKYYKEDGGGYKGQKPSASNNKLKKWTKQDWQWSGERKKQSSLYEKLAGKGVYLPAKSIDALKSSESGRSKLRSASRKKTEATNKGEQVARHGLHEGKDRSKLSEKKPTSSNEVSGWPAAISEARRRLIDSDTRTGRELTGDSNIPAVVYMAAADRQNRLGYKGDSLLGFKDSGELEDWATDIMRRSANAKIDARSRQGLRELELGARMAAAITPMGRQIVGAIDRGYEASKLMGSPDDEERRADKAIPKSKSMSKHIGKAGYAGKLLTKMMQDRYEVKPGTAPKSFTDEGLRGYFMGNSVTHKQEPTLDTTNLKSKGSPTKLKTPTELDNTSYTDKAGSLLLSKISSSKLSEEKRYRPKVQALLYDDLGRILASKSQAEGSGLRAYPNYKFPGGGVEPGESLVEAARKELLEEAGYEPSSDPEDFGYQPTKVDWDEAFRQQALAKGRDFHGEEQFYMTAPVGKRVENLLGSEGDQMTGLEFVPMSQLRKALESSSKDPSNEYSYFDVEKLKVLDQLGKYLKAKGVKTAAAGLNYHDPLLRAYHLGCKLATADFGDNSASDDMTLSYDYEVDQKVNPRDFVSNENWGNMTPRTNSNTWIGESDEVVRDQTENTNYKRDYTERT